MRMVSYNIRGGLGMDGRRSVARIAAVLRETGAAVAGLQEVHQRLPQSRFRDQPSDLERATDMACVFGPALTLGLGRYGNAVLTAVPVRRQQVHALPGDGEPRAALEVDLEMEGRTLTLFCTHFGLSESARAAQAAALAAAVRRVGGPAVVIGDLNAGPEAPEVRTLLAAGLAYAAPPVEPTFPSDRPQHRIDYILLSPELIATECQVIASTASDHLPVAAEIRWAEGR
jgi:endonuclease/exonuclease/phosphatase family metal-dependent hydrolase